MNSTLRYLQTAHTLSLDTETTGLEQQDLPFAVIIADDLNEYYFDERILGDMWNLLQCLTPKVWVFQNAKFDLKMCARMGFTPSSLHYYDIACGSRLMRNDPLQHSLDAQAKRYLGKDKSDLVKKYIKDHNLYEVRKDFFGVEYKSPRYDRVPVELMAEYACLDARLTYDLHQLYSRQLDPASLELYDMESQLIPVCLDMEETGLLLDKQYTLEAMYAEQDTLISLVYKYKSITGAEYVNSAKSIQKVLSIELPKTEGGNPSLTDDVIDWLLVEGSPRDKEIGDIVRSIRSLDKRITTYFKSYLNFATKQNIIHPTMWQAGTRTGRFSYSDPNLQNIPKEETPEYAHIVRKCFIPRAGKKYVSFDYSQMEYRMCVAYANETEIIEQVMNGVDFHQATADLVGITRKHAKTLNFAVLYGAGVDKIAAMLGCTVTQAEVLKYKYFSKLPKVERLIDSIIATGKSRGYVMTWTKRRMYADKEFCYALPNHLIQSGGADVVKKAMIQIATEVPEIPMVLQVHDQLVFEMYPEEFGRIEKIKQIMESVFPPMNGMTLKVDVSIGTSLAETDMVKYESN